MDGMLLADGGEGTLRRDDKAAGDEAFRALCRNAGWGLAALAWLVLWLGAWLGWPGG